MTAAVNSEVVAEPERKRGIPILSTRELGTKTNERLTAHVRGANTAGVDDVERCAGNAVRKVIEASKRGAGRVASDAAREIARLREGGVPKVPEHHGRAQDHGGWVGTVGAHNVLGDMTTARLEERVFLPSMRVNEDSS